MKPTWFVEESPDNLKKYRGGKRQQGVGESSEGCQDAHSDTLFEIQCKVDNMGPVNGLCSPEEKVPETK